MAHPQKYLFETSFDPQDIERRRADAAQKAAETARREEEARLQEEADAIARAAAEAEAEPPPAMFTEEEMSIARTQAYAEGEAAGQVEGQRIIEAQISQALEQAVPQIGKLIDRQHKSDAELRAAAVDTALAAVRKLLPEATRRRGLGEIEAVVRDCLLDMIDEPRIVIRVADEMLDMMRARIDPVTERLGFGGSIVLLAEPGMGPADCRIEWADGGAERLSSKVWQEIDAAVTRLVGHPTQRADLNDTEASPSDATAGQGDDPAQEAAGTDDEPMNAEPATAAVAG